MGSGTTETKTPLSELLEAASDIARVESRQTEDVLKDALDRYNQGKRLEALAMQAQARNLAAGRKTSHADIELAIAEYRREQPDVSH